MAFGKAKAGVLVAQAIEYSNATQLYGCMLDDDTRAKQMRLDWDDFKVRDTREFIRCYTRPRRRVSADRSVLVLLTQYCTYTL
jgi:hypothetical protein